MCVIIFIPKGETISKRELRQAWRTNSDGAGFASLENGEIVFKKGLMTFKEFYSEIKHKIAVYDLLLHFRISTSAVINKEQTHPNKKGAVHQLHGRTTRPLIAMNGIINGQIEYRGYNDTQSYIIDNGEAFKIISDTQSEELLDIVEDATDCRWAIATPSKVLLSKGFIYDNGKYYSNLNHKAFSTYSTYCNISKKPQLKDYMTPKLLKEVRKDKELYSECIQFLNIWYGVPYVIEDVFSSYTPAELEYKLIQYL